MGRAHRAVAVVPHRAPLARGAAPCRNSASAGDARAEHRRSGRSSHRRSRQPEFDTPLEGDSQHDRHHPDHRHPRRRLHDRRRRPRPRARLRLDRRPRGRADCASTRACAPSRSPRARRMPRPPSLAFYAGDLSAIDAVAVAQDGTAMQSAGWAALRRIAPGAPALLRRSSPRRSGSRARCGPRHPSARATRPRCSCRATACCARTARSAASRGDSTSSAPARARGGRLTARAPPDAAPEISVCIQRTPRSRLEGCRASRAAARSHPRRMPCTRPSSPRRPVAFAPRDARRGLASRVALRLS